MGSSFMEEPTVKIHKKDAGYLETYSISVDIQDGFVVYGGTRCENP